MSALETRIRAEIAAGGPMSLERFWNLALFDPQGGYYSAARPFGREGDFTTAPEISQMFGELLGAWMLAAWRALGAPSPFVLAEIGPGRGTLMADMLRTVRRLDPAFLRAAKVRLVETSNRLAAEQLQRLDAFDLAVVRVRRLEDLERLPLLLVANELFDAVAIRQIAFDGGAWRERRVGAEADGFRFVLGEPLRRLPAALAGLPPPTAGDILEVSPARDTLAAALAGRLAENGGAALLLDYGHARSGYGDTLQALSRHAAADPLGEPGTRDITAHVDFARLAAILAARGLHVAPVSEQGAFLASLGLLERAAALAGSADEAGAAAIGAAVRRLAGQGPGEMGALFKTLAAASRPLPLPPFPG